MNSHTLITQGQGVAAPSRERVLREVRWEKDASNEEQDTQSRALSNSSSIVPSKASEESKGMDVLSRTTSKDALVVALHLLPCASPLAHARLGTSAPCNPSVLGF